MSNVNNLELIQAKLPHWYKKYEKDKSVLYAIISSLAEQLDISSDFVQRLDEMLGIETTRDEDLEYRWGSLLNMPKSVNESYDDYRYKLMMTYSALTNGGTVESLKFAIAAILGVSRRSDDIDKYIKVFDAWEYDGDIPGYDPSVAKYGSFVCTIDFRILEGVSEYYSKLYDALNRTKASGTVPYFMIIYISEDDINVIFDEYMIDCIKDVYGDTGNIEHSNDTIFDAMKYVSNDAIRINSRKSNIFDNMSSVIANQTHTNRYLDSDEEKMLVNELINDEGNISMSDVEPVMSIHTDSSDLGRVSVDENLLDKVSHTIQEERNLSAKHTGMWDGFRGTNSRTAVLNTSLMTNMKLDADDCIDIITIVQ